jgi:hypothetical protein
MPAGDHDLERWAIDVASIVRAWLKRFRGELDGFSDGALEGIDNGEISWIYVLVPALH